MSIKLIIFDLEDVLIKSWHGIIKYLDIDETDFKTIDHSDLRIDLQLGKISEDTFFEEFIRITHTKYSVEELKSFVRQVLTPIDKMFDLVKSLKNRYKLAILSNFTKEWADYVIKKYELNNLFDATFWSFERGIKKPWHEAYLQVLDYFKISPQECVIIDDKIRNTEAAAKIGFNTITFENYDQLKQELNNLGVSTKPNIVLIGGGTGLPNLIKGLKNYDVNITAIVAVTDNGRHSGVLRREYNIPPPGDIRNSLVALSDADETLKKAFDYRFLDGHLEGTNLGNLLILSFTKLFGSFEKAIEHAGKILNIRGKVLPVTNANVDICAEYENGEIIEGEVSIRENRAFKSRIKRVFLKPNNVKALPEVIEEIEKADMIVLGPGRLYTSVITNLLVDGVVDAIRKSRAKKVYVCNTMTEPNVTDNFKVSNFVEAIENYLGKGVLNYVVVNTAYPDNEIVENYKEKFNISIVELDKQNLNNLQVIEGDFLNNEIKFKWNELSFLNHDPQKTADALMKILKM
ncbi:MAG: uridine diphosphate-N-acetylglucosamine-binding protein YvcK [Candidatus Aenigmatarchaeota archaeon]|nr:uridine diphosphate-N-acetylglucosamine-binding protein YvcK [Candidatus Aenigmarchaeota archaeon]